MINNIDWYDTSVFKAWNYKHTDNDYRSVIIDSLAVLIGEYSIYRKKAAMLLLKAFIRDNFLKMLLENKAFYPYDRNDYRAKKWTKEILSRGICETCGSTKQLEAHHIIKWTEFPQGRIDIRNGVCLCHKCHTEEHKEDQSYYMMKVKNS